MRVTLPNVLRVRAAVERRRLLYHQAVREALVAGGYYLLAEANTLAPSDTRELIEGSFVKDEGAGASTVVTVGYQADYAPLVHEDMSKAHGDVYNAKHAADIAAGRDHPRRPQEQAKFLETPCKTKYQELNLVVQAAFQAVLRSGSASGVQSQLLALLLQSMVTHAP